MLVKIVGVQARMGERLTLEEKLHIVRQRPDFVCLSEYCLLDETVTDYYQAAERRNEFLDYFRKLSQELSTCLIAGSLVESEDDRLYNTSYVIDRGVTLGRYRKRNPVPGELKKGITPGSQSLTVQVDGIRIGVLICGDVFKPELYEEQGMMDVDIIFIPTTSPYRPDESLSQKQTRDRTYFVDGAERACSYVVKVCGVGQIFGRPLQGRSLFAAPWGIVEQVKTMDEAQKRLLGVTLDMAEIRDFRRKYKAARASVDRSLT